MQTQRKLSLESDAFAAQNPAKQDSYLCVYDTQAIFCWIIPQRWGIMNRQLIDYVIWQTANFPADCQNIFYATK